MFIDEIKVFVRSGKGGDGMMHFLHLKFMARGGPDGGDGGHGGNVYLFVDSHLNTLSAFRNQDRFLAQEGKRGGINNQTGKSGDDLLIHVPPGTQVYDADSGKLLGDLTGGSQRLLVARGGRGGRGNPHFKNSRNQAPRTAEKGEPAQERNLRLELKLIADIGIVGMPNAGKSSLLAAVTNAKPKIANYPFTTLEPNLGVAQLTDGTTLVLADIPGLIEGAHAGAGLGDAFLRHIQRTKVLVHLLDGESDDPLADYTQINAEMALFDPHLGDKPQILALNKIDQISVQRKWAGIRKKFYQHGLELFPISALARTDLDKLLNKAAAALAAVPPEPAKVVEIPVYRPEEDTRAFAVSQIKEGWRVSGRAIERAAEMTYWDMDESVRRFQKLMETLGVDDALRKAGIHQGESVFIGENELEWHD
jgi:GTP-binding protein